MDAPAATKASAHKIAIIFYTMVKKQVEYDASLWAQRDAERENVSKRNSNGGLSISAANRCPSKKNVLRNCLNSAAREGVKVRHGRS
jgi:hypothetical protein